MLEGMPCEAVNPAYVRRITSRKYVYLHELLNLSRACVEARCYDMKIFGRASRRPPKKQRSNKSELIEVSQKSRL